jgi:hypothetical protein
MPLDCEEGSYYCVSLINNGWFPEIMTRMADFSSENTNNFVHYIKFHNHIGCN